MTPQTLRGWLPEVAAALDFMHVQGYVHRDVKPANIMFDQHGHVFLVDFGLIKALEPESPRKNAMRRPLSGRWWERRTTLRRRS